MVLVACTSGAALVNGLNMIVAGSVFNIISDVAIMALGLSMLPGLQVSVGKKCALVALFSVSSTMSGLSCWTSASQHWPPSTLVAFTLGRDKPVDCNSSDSSF